MTPDEFRRHAHTFVDWMADYLETVERYPVRARVGPGDIAARLPEDPPETGEPMEAIFRDFETIVMPGITHWQHPGFFAYFPCNSSPPSVLAEMLTATLGVQGMLWQTSPAATELEIRVLDWLRRMTGLSEGLAGVIQDTASSATLCALVSARERATQGRGNAAGLGSAGVLTTYCSAEAHSSVEKDIGIAGLGRENLRAIPVDETFALRPEALDAAIRDDRAAGRTPVCVVATLGTTGVSGFDPLRAIGEICRRHDIWLHVDAAWAGAALLLPEQRWMIDGVEHADSIVLNPHKWLLTNLDCSAYFVRDPRALTRSFAILPEYLKTAEGDHVVDFRDWGVPLGRRFRALKLWFVIRSYGVAGLREMIAGHIAMAQALADEVAANDDFEVLAPARLALFCFRYRPPGLDDEARLDALNRRLLDAINAGGTAYFTQTLVGGRFAIRFCVGQTRTERRHVEAAWRCIHETARALSADAS
ncbi:MAG: pyridoxal phosphate-dependent decarboxylase family protein [Alphaproteobacteria bacterium]